MTFKERYLAIEDFHQNEDGKKVLMTTWGLSTSGHDMFGFCATNIIVEPAYNVAIEHQGAHRVCRFGQDQMVSVVRLFLENSYQEAHDRALVKKLAPYLYIMGAIEKAKKSFLRGGNKHNLSSEELTSKMLGFVRMRLRHRSDMQFLIQARVRNPNLAMGYHSVMPEILDFESSDEVEAKQDTTSSGNLTNMAARHRLSSARSEIPAAPNADLTEDHPAEMGNASDSTMDGLGVTPT